MPIVDVDDEQVVVDRPAIVKQADSRAKDFTAEFDNDLVANLFVAILTLLVDVDPALVKCIMWFNSQTIRVPFASVTGTTSYLTIGPRDHGMNRATTAVQNGYDDPRFGTPGHTWYKLAAVSTTRIRVSTSQYRVSTSQIRVSTSQIRVSKCSGVGTCKK